MREFIGSIVGKSLLNFTYLGYNTMFVKGDYNTYYLFFFLENTTQLIELKGKAADIHNAIKTDKDIYQVDMDKNITCIFCLCVQDNEYYEMEKTNKISDLGKIVCLIEEDLNYFKKNVLIYTEKMDEFAQGNIGKFDGLCQKYLTYDNFISYKGSNKEVYKYDFLINLFIKLPFLNFQKYQLRNKQEYQTVANFIEIEYQKQAIDKKYIDDISGKIEEKLNDDTELYKWLDDLHQDDKEVVEVIRDENKKT